MDDTHTTLGRRFRTPAHPDILAALGRALYCFLSLEESLTAVMYDAGAADLSETRSKMAGGKEEALKNLAKRYGGASNGAQVAAVLDAAADAFGDARDSVRNELLHAHPFTVGYEADGIYLLGLAYTAQGRQVLENGGSKPGRPGRPSDSDRGSNRPAQRARDAVKNLPLSALQP